MADLDLIEKSCQELTEWNNLGIATPIPIYLPRPGCENGRRDWETEVKPILLRYLTSDQYTVVDLKG